MSKHCERVQKAAEDNRKIVNNGDYNACKNSADVGNYKDSLNVMDTRYSIIKTELGTTACGKVMDGYLTGSNVSDSDYEKCNMVTKNVGMALDNARGEYRGDHDKKDVSRTDYSAATDARNKSRKDNKGKCSIQ